MSDYKGAALMLDALPRAKAMLGDKGYDADWFRNALIERGIVPCIPSKANRKIPIAHDQTLYRQRHKIEQTVWKRRRIEDGRAWWGSWLVFAIFCPKLLLILLALSGMP